jgi:hypothetical protein
MATEIPSRKESIENKQKKAGQAGVPERNLSGIILKAIPKATGIQQIREIFLKQLSFQKASFVKWIIKLKAVLFMPFG